MDFICILSLLLEVHIMELNIYLVLLLMCLVLLLAFFFLLVIYFAAVVSDRLLLPSLVLLIILLLIYFQEIANLAVTLLSCLSFDTADLFGL